MVLVKLFLAILRIIQFVLDFILIDNYLDTEDDSKANINQLSVKLKRWNHW